MHEILYIVRNLYLVLVNLYGFPLCISLKSMNISVVCVYIFFLSLKVVILYTKQFTLSQIKKYIIDR